MEMLSDGLHDWLKHRFNRTFLRRQDWQLLENNHKFYFLKHYSSLKTRVENRALFMDTVERKLFFSLLL